MNMISAKFVVSLLLLLVDFNWTSFAKEPDPQDKGARMPRFIIGGNEARAKQFPYAVSIQKSRDLKTYTHICVYSLITTKSVIGAAHCVMTRDCRIESVRNYIGVLGSVDHKNRTVNVTFNEFRVHRHYDSEYLYDDIAVLVLSKPVQTGDFIETIPLIGRNKQFIGKRGTIIGWGVTAPSSLEPSQMLRYVNVDIVNADTCESYYGHLDEGQFCFGTKGKSGCTADSGAPITIRFRRKKVLAGIFSFNDDPCAKEPSVGINIALYTSWIRRKVEGTPVFVN